MAKMIILSPRQRNIFVAILSIVAGVILLIASSNFGDLTVIQALHDWGPFILICIGVYLFASNR